MNNELSCKITLLLKKWPIFSYAPLIIRCVSLSMIQLYLYDTSQE